MKKKFAIGWGLATLTEFHYDKQTMSKEYEAADLKILLAHDIKNFSYFQDQKYLNTLTLSEI